MKSRWILNLTLLLAIVILSIIAHYEPGIEPPEQGPAITALEQSDVHRIHINRPIREDLVLIRREDNQWWLDRSPPLPAEDFKVRALTRLVEQIPVRSYSADDMDLSALQLAPPYASAIFNDTAVEFGNLEPIDDLRYVRVADQVHLVPDSHVQLMEAGFAQFVRHRLFKQGARITAIHLPGIKITGTDSGGWQVEPQQTLGADALQAFVETWQTASALNLQTADTDSTGDRIEIRLQGRDTPIHFYIINREPELVLARPDFGVQYRMGNRSEALLGLDAAEADAKN